MKDFSSTSCQILDVSKLNVSYREAALWACESWIMWVWQTLFRPYDTMSLAEFWTTLSRLFWWDKFSNGTPYYANHLGALKSIWVINDISDPFNILLRGDVLVMLMRSVDSINYNNPVKTTHDAAPYGEHNAAGSYINEKLIKCYNYVDSCKNSAYNSDIACEYVCCNEKWEWVTPRSNDTCAPRPVVKSTYTYKTLSPSTLQKYTRAPSNTSSNISASTSSVSGSSASFSGSSASFSGASESFSTSWDTAAPNAITRQVPSISCWWNWSCWSRDDNIWDLSITTIWVKWEWEWKISNEELEEWVNYLWEDQWYWVNRELDAISHDNISYEQLLNYKDNMRLAFVYSWE